MEHFENAMLEVQKSVIRDSNGKMNQTDRNEQRNKLVDALALDLGAIRTLNGIALEIPHDEWGSFVIEIKVVAKNQDFIVESEAEAFIDKQAQRIARKAEAQRKAAERQAKIESAKTKAQKE